MEDVQPSKPFFSRSIFLDRWLPWSVAITAVATLLLWWQVELYALELEQQEMNEQLNYYALLAKRPHGGSVPEHVTFTSSEHGFSLRYNPRLIMRSIEAEEPASAAFELFDPTFVPPPQATGLDYRNGQDALSITIYRDYRGDKALGEYPLEIASSSVQMLAMNSGLVGPYFEIRMPIRGNTLVVRGFREKFLREALAQFRLEDF